MNHNTHIPALLLVACSLFSSCSLVNSGVSSSDLSSSNPAVAAQAQKVQELERQVSDQKTTAKTEKNKLEGLEQQSEGAKQNLKGLKNEAKAI
jgi:hypothetical protein